MLSMDSCSSALLALSMQQVSSYTAKAISSGELTCTGNLEVPLLAPSMVVLTEVAIFHLVPFMKPFVGQDLIAESPTLLEGEVFFFPQLRRIGELTSVNVDRSKAHVGVV